MSVSRALRFPDQVSPQTLRSVQKAVRDIGYVPNQLAGGLKATRTKLAAAIVPSVRNSLFAGTLQGLTNALRKSGINLMLGDSQYSQIEEEALIAAFLAHRPCGLVLHNSTHTAGARRLLQNSGIPIVEVGDLIARPIDLMVSFSNFEAAKAMTEHLLDRGYQKIVFVGLKLAGNERVKARRRGYLEALTGAGLSGEASFLETEGGFESGAQAVVQVLEAQPNTDAIFFAGDVLAIGAMMECRRRGWPVPQRVAIAGFDDWEISRQFETPITALEIPRYRIGELAADLIHRRLNGEVGRIKPIDVGFCIVERESTSSR
ncbi:MAG: LacI family transcriptional regulator, gluconate utilization system Gnt-I transcriptional repressor [Hyphomicrobiales bacterium]|nr:LacI family transcriptional regulator, gluconate utilization system Gnt-I transcriptional repressor [Hyphomicrobiales bacterium]